MPRTCTLLLLAALLPLPGCNTPPPREEKPDSPMFAELALPEVAEELMAMGEKDQDIRKRLLDSGLDNPDPELVRELVQIDQRNTVRLQEIVGRYGWPTRALVGEDASHAAWLLVQHADLNPGFQKEVLELLTPLVAEGQVRGSEFALLTDRVRVAENKPQVYGTQYQILTRGGQSYLSPSTPIAEPAQLDARRAALGLGPHAEYVEEVKAVYEQREQDSFVEQAPTPE